MMRNHNVVLTCISLGRRTEKRSSSTATSSPDLVKQQTRGRHDDAEEDGVWSPKSGYHLWRPFDCPQSWAPIYHTCQQTPHEMWTCGGNLSLPQSSEWDRFESLIQELDSKQSALSHPQVMFHHRSAPLTQHSKTVFPKLSLLGLPLVHKNISVPPPPRLSSLPTVVQVKPKSRYVSSNFLVFALE